jgi:hypothetical protein
LEKGNRPASVGVLRENEQETSRGSSLGQEHASNGEIPTPIAIEITFTPEGGI